MPGTSPGSRARAHRVADLPVLGLGFRPFFLAAGGAAAILVTLWVAALRGPVRIPTYYDGVGGVVAWHGHEMIFGYVAAVVAGFLLTSVRSWTELPTPTGGRLAALVALWLAGRVVAFLPGVVPAGWIAAIDLAFLPALGLALGLPLLRRPKARNLVVLPILGVLTLANTLIHLQALGITAASARPATYLAADLVVVLMVVIGGRVVPFFTQRALPGSEPRTWRVIEGIAIASVVALAAMRPVTPSLVPFSVFRAVATLAALVHAVRVVGWHDARIWSVPLLWVLFLGYGWLVAGFALIAVSPLLPLGPVVGLHAHTAGAMGTLTLGMMSRVALGHTGRPLVAPRPVVIGFGLVSLAAVTRVLLPLLAPRHYGALLIVAGTLWILAFLLFLAAYGPILLGPRVDGRPG